MAIALRISIGLFALLVIATGLATIAGFAGAWWWIADLLSHFRPGYAVALTCGMFACLFAKRWWPAFFCACLAAVNIWLIAPLVTPGQMANASGPDVRLIAWNAGGATEDQPELIHFIAQEHPDLIVVSELTPQLDQFVREHLAGYKAITLPLRGALGIGAYARGEITRGRTPELRGIPTVELGLQKNGVTVNVLGVRATPPKTEALSKRRDGLLAEVTRWVTSMHGKHVIVVGDFNATPWSYPVRTLVSRGRLENAGNGYGLHGTWPTPLGVFALPVDQCLHSANLVTVKYEVGPNLGSSHYPLLVTLRAKSTSDAPLVASHP